MLRDGSGQNLREYLITTAARLIEQRGSAGLAVRDIAREAQVADGVLYNYFEDKEDLLAHALLAHVASVMGAAPRLLPPPGEGELAENLRRFIDGGIAVLVRVTPAFAGLLSQPKVLSRFHAMVGGHAAFDAAAGEPGRVPAEDAQGLPGMLTGYLRAEQRLGRVGPDVDVEAASSLIVGAMHGQVLPRLLFTPPGSPVVTPPGLAAGLADTVLRGIGPRSQRG